jgi:MinD-like ATPase involved in chromosome partitioning or flagellar assembly
VLIACWAAKGGAGTTVVATALARVLSAGAPAGALLADLAGDVPAVLGLPDPPGPGLADWLTAGEDVPPDALTRLEVEGPAGLRVLPWAGGPPATAALGLDERASVLAAVLAADPRPAVVDCGTGPVGAGLVAASAATTSLLVLRPCYLALKAALRAPLRPSGIVLVAEPGRALGPPEVEDVLGVPVRAVVGADPAVARAVDAGSLGDHLPRRLERAVRGAA